VALRFGDERLKRFANITLHAATEILCSSRRRRGASSVLAAVLKRRR
jgi:hypothetical protein